MAVNFSTLSTMNLGFTYAVGSAHLAVRPVSLKGLSSNLHSPLLAAAVIEQRGPHETIIASSAIKGTPDMIPDPKADETTIDPRSENVIGSVMYKKTSPSRLSSFGYLDDAAGHALGSSELSWEALRTHFKKAKVTTVEVGELASLTRSEWLLMCAQQIYPVRKYQAVLRIVFHISKRPLIGTVMIITCLALTASLFLIRINPSSLRLANS